jgi:hypothetical protein
MERLVLFAAVLVLLAGMAWQGDAYSRPEPRGSGYKVLAPIHQGNLTVFPVVGSKSFDTAQFLTLDEGLRSGDVIVTESGSIQPMMRRRRGIQPPYSPDGAQVNKLMLVNNSERPLLLLAGEIVTGGKQDRIIGKDRLIPAESDPIDLGVFCVEPGRWVQTSSKFDTAMVGALAAPSVRGRAMADKDQAKVWSEVRKAQSVVVGGAVPLSSTETVQVEATSSYARVMDNKAVQKQVDSVAQPIENGYRSLIKQLRDQNALGVVVAVNGEIIWADVFASTDLLQKYWPKLVRSYAAEAILNRATKKDVSESAAQAFLDHLDGRHESVESEPGLYRQTEITGDGFKAFELTSLLPKTGFDIHIAKMLD